MGVKKTVVKDVVNMFGITEGKDSCHNCVSLDKQVNEIIPKAEIPVEYKHYELEKDAYAEKVAKEKNITNIPYVEHCKITEDEKKYCDTVIGYNANDWTNLGKKRQEEFKEED